MRITVSYLSATSAVAGGTGTFLDNVEAPTWHAPLNEVGNGSCALVLTDTNVAAITVEDVIQMWLDGTVVFSFVVEQVKRSTIDPKEESGQVAVISGRGLFALLDDIVVYPAGGATSLPASDKRIFFFGMLGYDDTGTPWENANQQAYYSQPGGTPNWHDVDGNLAPHKFPDSGGNYIWNSLGDVNNAPVGTVYFRKTFTLAAAQQVVFYASGDNLWQVWLDGVEILGEIADGTTWLDTQRSKVFPMSAGNHVLAARVTNTDPYVLPGPTFAPDPAFLLLAAYTVNTSTGEETFLLRTDSSWRVTSYLADAPPVTCGQILNMLLAEATARGCIIPTVTFTNALDSDGLGWNTRSTAGAPITDFTTNVGSSLIDVLRQMAETYVDFLVGYAGGWVLNVYDKSGHIPASGVALVSAYVNPTTGNLTSLDHTTKT